MSPTSRWSRNWTPLTTRPSLTSRHGTILRAGIQGLRQADMPFPQRLSDDRSGGAQPAQVVKRRDSPGGLDGGMGEAPGRFFEKLEIGAGEHSVTADVGEEEMPSVGVERGDVPEAEARILGPAGGGDDRHSVDEPDVQRERDPLA